MMRVQKHPHHLPFLQSDTNTSLDSKHVYTCANDVVILRNNISRSSSNNWSRFNYRGSRLNYGYARLPMLDRLIVTSGRSTLFNNLADYNVSVRSICSLSSCVIAIGYHWRSIHSEVPVNVVRIYVVVRATVVAPHIVCRTRSTMVVVTTMRSAVMTTMVMMASFDDSSKHSECSHENNLDFHNEFPFI
jgi:hypothetical protein